MNRERCPNAVAVARSVGSNSFVVTGCEWEGCVRVVDAGVVCTVLQFDLENMHR